MRVNILNFLSAGFFLSFISCNIQVVDSAKTSALRYQASILVHVDPKGDGDGSHENPLGTLEQARDRVRELRLAGERRNIDIILNDGTYELEKTFILNLSDSAPEGSVTRYIAAKNSNPIISGGVNVMGWEKTDLQKENIWVAKVPWAKGNEFFHCLFDNTKLLSRAQSKKIIISNKSRVKDYAGELKYKYEFGFEDPGNNGIIKNWDNLEDIELFGMPTRKWLVNYLPIESLDMNKKEGKLAIQATYRMGGEFFVENSLDHLDTPGEWALNSKKGLLYYWPKSGKPGENIVAPRLDELIRIEGESDLSIEGLNDKPVNGIVFEGITFSYADRQKWTVDDIGLQHDWNMWDKSNGLLRFRGTQNCIVNNCTFINSGSDGVRFDLFSQNNTVQNSTFNNLGGTGILFSGYGPGLKDVNKRNKIYNNELTDVGSLFWHSPGIFIWQSGSNLISSNHIYDQGYSGLLISGVRRRFFDPIFKKMGQGYPYSRWSFPKGGRENLGAIRWDEISLESITEWSSYEPYMHARNNIIEYNEVHDCLKRLHDGNAIYLSAHGNGNIIRKNVTYNHPEGALIRTDDDSHNVTVTENICIGSEEPESQGLCLKGLNFFENNLLFNSMLLTGSAGNTADIRSSYQKNIVYFSKKDSVFHKRLNMFSKNLNKNIYYNPNIKLAENFILEEQKGKRDTESIAADPLFVNMSEGNFSFKKKSPAIKLGINAISLEEVKKIGCTRDPWLERAIKFKGFPMVTK